MGNGDFVTWPAFKEHTDKSDEGFERLSRLEAEVMGDEMTHRPSLRVEFIREMTKTRRTIVWLILGVGTEQGLKWLWEYLNHVN